MLETTKEEYFTPQLKAFVSVFSIKFSLAGCNAFNSANPHRVRFRRYAIDGNSSKLFLESAESTKNTERDRTYSTQFIYKSYNIRQLIHEMQP